MRILVKNNLTTNISNEIKESLIIWLSERKIKNILKNVIKRSILSVKYLYIKRKTA